LHFLLWHSLAFLFSCYFAEKGGGVGERGVWESGWLVGGWEPAPVVVFVAAAHDHGCHIRF